MLISIVIPACEAQATLADAVDSILQQTLPTWEAIIVSDDGFDYRSFLAATGRSDPRLHFTSTGGHRTGCHNARNVGLRLVRGDVVTQLDADDLFTPSRLATLAPIALARGACADNLAMIAMATGLPIAQAAGNLRRPAEFDMRAFLTLNAPLVPLVRRDHVELRLPGIEFSEDVVANLRLIDRIGMLPVLPEAYYIYRIAMGSVANSVESGARFDEAYAGYIERLDHGDGLGLSPANRPIASAGIRAKRALNLAFEAAHAENPHLTFQDFVNAPDESENWPIAANAKSR